MKNLFCYARQIMLDVMVTKFGGGVKKRREERRRWGGEEYKQVVIRRIIKWVGVDHHSDSRSERERISDSFHRIARAGGVQLFCRLFCSWQPVPDPDSARFALTRRKEQTPRTWQVISNSNLFSMNGKRKRWQDLLTIKLILG